VDRGITHPAEVVEKLADVPGQQIGVSQVPEHVLEAVARHERHAGPRGDLLGEKLPQLPGLADGGGGVIVEEVLRQPSKAGKLRFRLGQEVEVALHLRRRWCLRRQG
jgi:hypothetical protein